MNTLTEETLKELEALKKLSTKGKWGVFWGNSMKVSTTKFTKDDKPVSSDDCRLIAAMQNALPALISSAREALRLREALEEIDQLPAMTTLDVGGWYLEAFRIAARALGKPEGSTTALPASSDTPETDALPAERDQECAHGVYFGKPCEECHQEVLLRKGLDDHSCNSTGWEKP